MDEVAQRAGVSKGTVYLYFKSKDDLFQAMVEKQVVTLLESAEAMARDHAGSATELLTKVIHRMWEALSRNNMVCLTRLVQAELTQFPEVQRFYFEHVIQRHRRLLRSIAERGIASGEFRREAVTMIPLMVPSLVVQLNQTRFLFGGLDTNAPAPDVVRDLVVSFVLDGVQARPVASRPAAPVRRKKG